MICLNVLYIVLHRLYNLLLILRWEVAQPVCDLQGDAAQFPKALVIGCCLCSNATCLLCQNIAGIFKS